MRFHKRLLIHLFGVLGIYPTRMTPNSDMRRLLRNLAPRQTDRELIRLGPDGDGGYLVPDDLEGIAACFSPGVSTISGFEKDCARRGMPVYMADASIDHPSEEDPQFHFTKQFIGAVPSDAFITLDEWIANSEVNGNSDLLLQMDIEGYEYEVLLAMSHQLLQRMRIVVVEFHRLDHLWVHSVFRLASRAFAKLCQSHTCVHIHPNNKSGAITKGRIQVPCTAEFTFLRNDRIERQSPATTFPHPLDADNARGPTLVLPQCWHLHDE